jgi:hypothetical protein
MIFGADIDVVEEVLHMKPIVGLVVFLGRPMYSSG